MTSPFVPKRELTRYFSETIGKGKLGGTMSGMRSLRSLRLITLLLAIAILTLRCAPTATPTPNLLSIARAHTQAGEYTAAEAALREVAASRQNDPQSQLELATLYQMWNRPGDGLKALTSATQNGATANQTTHLRLELLTMAHYWSQILIEADSQLDVAPNDPIALQALTQAYLHQQQCAQATETAQHWREVAPENLDATRTWGALANHAVLLCEVSEALCTIAESCCDGQYSTRLGLALIRTGDWPLAACVLSRAITEDGTTAETYAWLGEALIRIGRPAEARAHLIKATTLAPDSPLPWTLLGAYYFQQQEIAAAREVLLRAHQLDPGNPAPCLMVAEIKAQASQYDQANIWLEAATNAAPNDATVWKAVARFYLQRHLIEDGHALQAIEQAIRLAPNDGDAHMLLGWIQLLKGDMPSALAALEEATTLAPESGQAHHLRGQAFQASGNLMRAQEAFTLANDLGYRP